MALDTNAYLTVAEVREASQAKSASYELRVEDAINSACAEVNLWCGRRFYVDAEASARTMYPATPTLVNCPYDISSTSGLVIKTDTSSDGTYSTTWTASDYQLEPLNQVAGGIEGHPFTRIRAVGDYGFPSRATIAPVQVTAKWGWSAVPYPVRQAALQLAVETLKLPEAPFGAAGFDALGATVRVRDNPKIARMLQPYVREFGIA